MKLYIMTLFLAMTLQAESLKLPENFKADFKQIITNTKSKSIHYEGKVYFSNVSSLKWAYTLPTQKEVCTNTHGLTIVDHDLEQVSTYAVSKAFNFLEIVKDATLHSPNVFTSKFDGKTVTIQVDKKKKLHSIAYYDDLDNKVQIVFKLVKYGKGNLPQSSISCLIPDEYDFIRG